MEFKKSQSEKPPDQAGDIFQSVTYSNSSAEMQSVRKSGVLSPAGF